jgi:hypothetical protein
VKVVMPVLARPPQDALLRATLGEKRKQELKYPAG